MIAESKPLTASIGSNVMHRAVASLPPDRRCWLNIATHIGRARAEFAQAVRLNPLAKSNDEFHSKFQEWLDTCLENAWDGFADTLREALGTTPDEMCKPGPQSAGMPGESRGSGPICFHVAGWEYRVHMANSPLLDDDGEKVDGLVMFREHEIWLAFNTAGLQHRIGVILHELRHAWEHHVGKPSDVEVECQLTATINEQFRQDLVALGWEGRIENLRAEPWPYAEPGE